MSQIFHDLTVQDIQYPLANVATITFAIPTSLKSIFRFKPGQHLVIECSVNNKKYRRNYSIHSNHLTTDFLKITVKLVKGGIVSTYLINELKVGDQLPVLPPTGNFYATIHQDNYKSYYLFAAGSGITPIISILKSIALSSPMSHVYLLYGNKNQDSIIFKPELEKIKEKYSNRINIELTLSQPKVWNTWKSWKGLVGRINKETVETFIQKNPPIAQQTEYYICGPGKMNQDIRMTLQELGIPSELIHIEHFANPSNIKPKQIVGYKNATLNVLIAGTKHNDLVIGQDETILTALKMHQIKFPYSCESGVCGTCVAKLKKGTVEMKSCMALSEKEIKNGYVLTCQSIPTSKEINIEV